MPWLMTVRFNLERTWLAMGKSDVVCNWSDFFAGRCLNFFRHHLVEGKVVWIFGRRLNKGAVVWIFYRRLNKGEVVWIFLDVVWIKAKSSDLIVNGEWPRGSFQVVRFICQDARFLPSLYFIGQSLIILNKNKQNYASVINQTQSFSAKMGMGQWSDRTVAIPAVAHFVPAATTEQVAILMARWHV